MMQKFTRGYKVHREYKVKLHRFIVDYYVDYWKQLKIRNHTNLQVKLKYAYKNYKIKKAKKAADKKKKEEEAKKKKKKPAVKPVDPMETRVTQTVGGQIDIKTSDPNLIGESSMLDDPRLLQKEDEEEAASGDSAGEGTKNEDLTATLSV